MLEALVRKSDGAIILVRDPGQPWGRKERGEPFFAIELEDSDLEAKHTPGRVTSYPYAEWKEVREDIDGVTYISHKRLQDSVKRVRTKDRQHMNRVQIESVDDAELIEARSVTGTKPRERIDVRR